MTNRTKGFSQIIFIIILALTALVGAGGYFLLVKNTPSPVPVPSPVPSPVPTPEPQPTPIPSPTQQESKNTVFQAHNDFGFDIFKTLALEEGNANIFISPSSIAMALSMVYNGAQGETKTAMEKTLHAQGIDMTMLNQENKRLSESLQNPDPKVTLSIANSLWIRQGKIIEKAFINEMKKSYNAEISTLDFNDSQSANTINAWVKNETRGKISQIVSSPISPEMMLYLINAIYFKGSWTTAFDKTLTEDRDFTPNKNEAIKHPFMRRHDDFLYAETESTQSVILPYGANERLEMVIFLPKDLQEFITNLNKDTWNDWMKKYKKTEGTVLLPKFTMEYEKELKPLLVQLGMGIAFQDAANFNGIGTQLKISAVKHKTYVDVNEEGTEAAAVTSIGMAVPAFNPEEKKIFYMEINHPFFFAIRDSQTQEIVFMGVVQNP